MNRFLRCSEKKIFIFKIPVLNIGDLAKVMVKKLAPEYVFKPNQIETLYV